MQHLTSNDSDSKVVYFLFLLMGAFFIFNGIVSEGFGGGADSITHYQMARFSWVHPHLFMNQWGKPIFTAVASPFAQLGFKAVVFMNLAFLLWGAWLSWLIAKRVLTKNAWLVPFFVLMSPVVLENSVSGLTEMICALFLILYLYLYLENKLVLGSILVSFMPFARSEGFVVLAVLILFYLFTSRWKWIPYLLVGSIVFNTIGYFYEGKLLWIFDSNPYVSSSDSSVYGKGSFFHFFIFGVPTLGISFLLTLVGTVLMFKWVPGAIWKREGNPEKNFWIWVVLGPAWGYFLAHTVLWWLGMWNSLGLLRVLFVILVPMVLVAVYAFNVVSDKLTSERGRSIFLYTFLAITSIGPFLFYEFPIPAGIEEQVNKKAAAYVQENVDVENSKFFSAHPYFNFSLGIDPWDRTRYQPLWDYKQARSGDYLVWDGHFGPNEHRLPLDTLLSDSTTYEMVQNWRPAKKFITLNGYPYEIVLFRKR